MGISEETIYSIVEKAKKYDELKFFNTKKEVSCSFCGKSQSAVNRIIVGSGVSICNECIDICVEIINEEDEHKEVNEHDVD